MGTQHVHLLVIGNVSAQCVDVVERACVVATPGAREGNRSPLSVLCRPTNAIPILARYAHRDNGCFKSECGNDPLGFGGFTPITHQSAAQPA